jgi:hypothetical protein
MPRPIHTTFDFQNTSKVTGLPAPTAASDAANKAYVDSAIEGLAWKDSCRVATQANLNLAGPGATIDGVTMALQDRVTVRAQTAGAENGIYIWNGASSAMTRSLDASTFDELENAVVGVEEGSSAGVSYRQTAINGTLGTTTITWVVYGGNVPPASTTQAGTVRFATQSEMDAGTPGVAATPDVIKDWIGRLRKFSADIGDGSATSYTVTHNFGTRDVVARVFPNSGQFDDIELDVQRPSTNAVTLVFASAPAANAYRVVVIG